MLGNELINHDGKPVATFVIEVPHNKRVDGRQVGHNSFCSTINREGEQFMEPYR